MAPFIEREVVVNPGQTATVEVRVKPMGGVAGTVENVSTDTLLKGVRIELLDANGAVVRHATTGADGSYRFPGLPGGTYTVRMVLPRGYLPQGDSEQVLDVPAGREVRADFQLVRHGMIEGRVVTEDGQPLVDAEVSLIDSGGAILRTVRTGADGTYAFADVPVDKYTVRVDVPDALEG